MSTDKRENVTFAERKEEFERQGSDCTDELPYPVI